MNNYFYILFKVESVYRKSVTTGTTQSLVMMGRSGAGKSCNLKKSLAYLIETSQDLDTSKLTSKCICYHFDFVCKSASVASVQISA